MINIPRWKVILVIALSVLGILYALPNALPPSAQRWLQDHMPAVLPHQTVNLGLDLRGGSHLLLDVQLDVALADHLNSMVDEVRSGLRKEKITYTELGVRDGKISFRVGDPAQIDAAREAVRINRSLDIKADGQLITIALPVDMIRERQNLAMDQSMEIVRRRIDETGTREPSIQRQGGNRILVQLPGVDDPQRIKQLMGQTAKLAFRFVDENATFGDPKASPPPGTERLPAASSPDRGVVVQKRVILSGEALVDSQASYDQYNNAAVSFKFDSLGGKKFAEATRANVGRLFAIVLDNKVLSFPKINEPILGGSGIITGHFTIEEAKDLALLLRAGALPAPIKVLEERTVGPGLGEDSIKAGALAAVGGIALVVIFMLLSYGLFGIFGTIALFINLAFIFALLSILQATLTLPGIAGIVLTVGMAVDANVLIFERIREEARLGRSIIASIDAGYSRALSAIMDANVTTLISAFLLMIFGSGPIKGFGVTLTIGTITSVFSAVWVTRLMVIAWLRVTKPKAIPI
ncbi:MAG: protein translocase subunit SecD [Alphaproteobacteria bacterium]